MRNVDLKDNGKVWERMPAAQAKDFLQGKEYGIEHPSRIKVRNWLRNKYEVSKVKPSLLDVPCGSGVDFGLLAELTSYTGCDRTVSVVEGFKLNHPGIPVFISDIRNLEAADKSFDIVLARAIFEHLPDIGEVELAMKECVRVAKEYVIFSFFIPLLETEHIDWNGNYFNNQYAKKDVEAIMKKLGLTWEHEFVGVEGTPYIDDYDIYFAKV